MFCRSKTPAGTTCKSVWTDTDVFMGHLSAQVDRCQKLHDKCVFRLKPNAESGARQRGHTHRLTYSHARHDMGHWGWRLGEVRWTRTDICSNAVGERTFAFRQRRNRSFSVNSFVPQPFLVALPRYPSDGTCSCTKLIPISRDNLRRSPTDSAASSPRIAGLDAHTVVGSMDDYV